MLHREQDIIQWAKDRGIFDPEHGSSKNRQADKTMEEIGELFEAIDENNTALAMDAIGDIIVTLVIQAHMWNLNITECVEAAWQEIKDRKGRMINGQFVKRVSIDDATPEEWDEAARSDLNERRQQNTEA